MGESCGPFFVICTVPRKSEDPLPSRHAFMIQFQSDSTIAPGGIKERPIDLKIFSHAQLREKEAAFSKKLVFFSVATGLVGWLLGFVMAAFIGSSQLATVKIENVKLQYHVDTYQQRLNQMELRVDQIASRDRAIYHMLFGLDPETPVAEGIPPGVADVAEHFLPAESAGEKKGEITVEAVQYSDNLYRQVAQQAQSLNEVSRWQDNLIEDLRQTPAIKPADGFVSSSFGMRVHPILGVRMFHKGIDIAVNTGTPVHATASGVISSKGYDKKLGHYVKILHKNTNLYTLYAHLSIIPEVIYRGKKVDRGTVIGFSGNTGLSAGPHLHYEIQNTDGIQVDPSDYILSEMTPVSGQYLAQWVP